MNKNKFTMNILEKLSLKITTGQYPGMESKVDTLSSNPNSVLIKNNTKLLFIFTGTAVGIDDSIKEVIKLKQLGYTVDVAMSEAAETMFLDKVKTINPNRLFTSKDRMNYLEMIQDADAVIVPVATQNTGIKLSLGIQDSFISMLLWQILWQGKTLFMNMDDMTTHSGMESKSKMLLQMMSGYVDKLKRLGVKPMSILNLSSKIHESFATVNDSKVTIKDAELERTIITEKDILKRAKGETINVHPRTIITALARDAARNLSIKIVKQNI